MQSVISIQLFDPRDKTTTFSVQCLLRNSARWNAARNVIPRVESLVLVAGHLLGYTTDDDGTKCPAIALLEMCLLPGKSSEQSEGSGVANSGDIVGQAGTDMSPARRRYALKLANAKKGKSGTTPLPIPSGTSQNPTPSAVASPFSSNSRFHPSQTGPSPYTTPQKRGVTGLKKITCVGGFVDAVCETTGTLKRTLCTIKN